MNEKSSLENVLPTGILESRHETDPAPNVGGTMTPPSQKLCPTHRNSSLRRISWLRHRHSPDVNTIQRVGIMWDLLIASHLLTQHRSLKGLSKETKLNLILKELLLTHWAALALLTSVDGISP